MTNPIYQALSAYLKTLPGIAHVDLWNSQMADDPEPYKGAGGAFPTPAVFIEFPPFTSVPLGAHLQRAELKPRLHLVTERYQATDTNAGEQAPALQADTDLVALITRKLTGWRAVDSDTERTICNSWSRTGIAGDTDFDNVVETVQEWRTVAFDYSAVRTTQAIVAPSPQLVITGSTE